MPGADDAFAPIVNGCEIRLWWDVPADCWLRRQGKTRVLLIDDQVTSRERLLGVVEDAPPSPDEARLERWLNTELQFFGVPEDYHWDGTLAPEGTFDDKWFDRSLCRVLEDSTPIAAVMLDLLYGREARVQESSGRRFLAALRRRLPGVPIFITSNVTETPEVVAILKRGDDDIGESSFQTYLPKHEPGDRRPLLPRLAERLVEWGEVSDPELSAFSRPMRRLARQMRKIALRPERIRYEASAAGDFPRPVVVAGEFGSGKNHIAHRLRMMSSRRSAPFEEVNFGAISAESLPMTLFGSTSFTGAAQCYEVRISDGAVLRTLTLEAAQQTPPGGKVYLGQTGVLQQVDIAGQPFGNAQRPLGGSVLFDEIGAAPQDVQTRLLGVLNNGRFIPHLGNEHIPSTRAIDVWFLVTVSPEARLRPDLAMRLSKGHVLRVPPLRERREDVIPLALRLMHAPLKTAPHELFTPGALQMLEQRGSAMQVRDLYATLGRLGDITASPYVSAPDLVDAGLMREPGLDLFDQRTSALAEFVLPETPSTAPPPSALPARDDLHILTDWRSREGATYAVDARDPSALLGRGEDVIGGAAAAVLSYLELCTTITAPNGKYSATRAWQFFADAEGAKPGDARTRLASMFCIDDKATLAALRRSDVLLWLAIDVAKRRGEVERLLDRLAREDGQQARIRRLREPKLRASSAPTTGPKSRAAPRPQRARKRRARPAQDR